MLHALVEYANAAVASAARNVNFATTVELLLLLYFSHIIVEAQL